MSTVIPREKLSAYQRWELNSFDTGTRPTSGPTAPEARPDPRQQQDGYDAGYREGLAAAQAEVARAAAAQTARLNEIIATLGRDMARLDTQVADHVLDLAITLSRRIIGDTLAVRPELVIPVVREALQMLGQARAPARLVLHPDDAKLVREQLGDQCGASGWTLSEDATLARGGCRLESAGGELDATLQTRWERILAPLGRDTAWVA